MQLPPALTQIDLLRAGFRDRADAYPVILLADAIRRARFDADRPSLSAYAATLRDMAPLRPHDPDVFIGRHEITFAEALRRCFGDRIHTNVTVAGDAERPYVPDVVYADPKTGTLLDIEIDEPYSRCLRD